MPLTVFDIKGVPGTRRERIEAAVVAGVRHTPGPHEAWIAADPFKGWFRILITGPDGFECTVTFAIEDDPAVIADRVRRRSRSRCGSTESLYGEVATPAVWMDIPLDDADDQQGSTPGSSQWC